MGSGVLLAVEKSIPVLSFSTLPDLEVVTIVCFPKSPLTVSISIPMLLKITTHPCVLILAVSLRTLLLC